MKHPISVVSRILIYYLIIQIFSLVLIQAFYSKFEIRQSDEAESKSTFNWFWMLLLIVTGLYLFLIAFKAKRFISLWANLSLFFAFYLTISMIVVHFFKDLLGEIISLCCAFILIFVRKTRFRNFTEIFIYAGPIGVLLPFLNTTYLILLLIFLSIYDFVSVRITKHMILMAKSLSNQASFLGLEIGYGKKTKIVEKSNEVSYKKAAMLGGGDIAFPLLFCSHIMIFYGVYYAMATLLGSIIGLILIFKLSEKDKFYPAIPYLTFFMFSSLAIVRLFF